MKNLIVCFSYHHKNTEKIASIIAEMLEAEIKKPFEVDPNMLGEYDLIGFGSGIYFSKHHNTILELADKMPKMAGKKAFIFSTSGLTKITAIVHQKLKQKLESKGLQIVGEFNCAGFDTFGPFRVIGGIQKGHPNEEDYKQVKIFASSLK